MADAYLGVIDAARSAASPEIRLPPHLRDDGTGQAKRLATDLGVAGRVADLFG
jgi:hypothetical protein